MKIFLLIAVLAFVVPAQVDTQKMRTLEKLITPLSGLQGWYPGNEWAAATDSDPVDDLLDYSNSGGLVSRELFNGDLSGLPTIAASAINGWPAVKFASSHDKPLTYVHSGTIGIKHVFVLAKLDAANFSAYRGLVSDAATNAVLLGDNGTTKFYDPTPAVVSYYKNGVSYAQNNMQAPANEWALLEISNATGWSLDGFQIGQDRGTTGRRWRGWIIDPMFLSSVQSGAGLNRIRLYYALKYGIWRDSAGAEVFPIYFPSPGVCPELMYYRYREIPFNWDGVTVKNTYDDDGASFSTTTDDPPQKWEIGYQGLTLAQAEIFDAFNDAVRRDRTFNFIDKAGATHTGVRIESYERNHESYKSWRHFVNITLVKYP